mmetsp:Transcript_42526/g.43095  ORF Transcript_42526/g.43095 Transcript_42526/m.43095 type:complete len:97 (-) Transcript_42526:230-520(-)
MKLHLKNDYKDLIKAEEMRQEDCPQTLKGNKKSFSGRLPLCISPLSFQAYLKHRVRVVGKTLDLLSKMPLKQSRVDNTLALQIKNIGETCSVKFET